MRRQDKDASGPHGGGPLDCDRAPGYCLSGWKKRLSSQSETSLPILRPWTTELRKWKPSHTRASGIWFWMSWTFVYSRLVARLVPPFVAPWIVTSRGSECTAAASAVVQAPPRHP